MTTFTKIWAIRSDSALVPGERTRVTLKSGGTSEVLVGPAVPGLEGCWVVAVEPKPQRVTQPLSAFLDEQAAAGRA